MPMIRPTGRLRASGQSAHAFRKEIDPVMLRCIAKGKPSRRRRQPRRGPPHIETARCGRAGNRAEALAHYTGCRFPICRTIMPTPLCPAEVLVLTGADAAAFAQAQFTSDVKSLRPGTWQWSAWLDPQGRARFFFALLHVEPGRFIAWLPLGGAATMRDAIRPFVMRAAVQLDASSDWTLHRLDDDPASVPSSDGIVARDGGFAFAQPRQRGAWIAPIVSACTDAAALDRWRREDIASGLPLLVPQLAGEFVAQALDLERIDAIRFDKGCYPGQEIAARLHFRGGNKRHLQRLAIDGAAPAPATAILDREGRNMGRILYAVATSDARSEALGVLLDTRDAGPLATSTNQAVQAGPAID